MKWNRNTWALYVSAVFYLQCFPTAESVEKLVFIDDIKGWQEAYTHCRDLNGVMVSQGDLQAFTIPPCAIDMSQFWIGNVVVVTPLLSLRACVNASKDETSGYYIGQNNSVEQCAALCSEYLGFQIQKDYCRCLEETNRPLPIVSAKLCSYFCKEGEEKQFCGGENVANVYIFNERDVTDGPGGCAFATCEREGEKFTLVSADCYLEASDTVILCRNEDIKSPYNRNVSDWFSACQKCVEIYGTYPIESLKEQQCCFGSCCIDDSCLDCYSSHSRHPLCSSTWTSTRRYQGNIFIQDAELDGFDIESCSYSEVTSSIISFNTSQSCVVSDINIACKINARDVDKFSCYTTMESTSLSVNTKDTETSTTQTWSILSSDIRTSTMGYTMSLTKGGLENGFPTGIIVGVILGLSIVIAAVVTIVLFRRRAMCFSGQKKKTNNKDMVYRSETEHENVVIYQSTKDSEYDNLNVKRKHAAETKSQSNIYHHVTNPTVKGSSENTYDEMKRTNQHLSESTYYSHAKSPNPLLTGVTGNEYDISGHVQPVDQTISSENAYDVCSKSEDPT